MTNKEAKRLADLFASDLLGKKWHAVRVALGERARDTCSEKVGR